MQVEFVIVVALFAASAGVRMWQIFFAYKQSLRRIRERRRALDERDLFDRLERCMQSDRVD